MSVTKLHDVNIKINQLEMLISSSGSILIVLIYPSGPFGICNFALKRSTIKIYVKGWNLYMFPVCNQLLIKSIGSAGVAKLIAFCIRSVWLMCAVLVYGYDVRSPPCVYMYRTCTDHIPIMQVPPRQPIRSPQSHAHPQWTNQSPLCEPWLFWTNQWLICQSGIHAQTPPCYLNTVW